MFLSISKDGTLALEDINAMKSFSIVKAIDPGTQGAAITALQQIAEPAEDNHYWLDIDSVIALSASKNDAEWVEKFWKMLTAAEPYGYVDMENRRVKAHLETK